MTVESVAVIGEPGPIALPAVPAPRRPRLRVTRLQELDGAGHPVRPEESLPVPWRLLR